MRQSSFELLNHLFGHLLMNYFDFNQIENYFIGSPTYYEIGRLVSVSQLKEITRRKKTARITCRCNAYFLFESKDIYERIFCGCLSRAQSSFSVYNTWGEEKKKWCACACSSFTSTNHFFDFQFTLWLCDSRSKNHWIDLTLIFVTMKFIVFDFFRSFDRN